MSLPIPLYALILEEELRKSKHGRLFWQVLARTTVGTYKAFMWNCTADAAKDVRFPHVGDIIEVSGFEDETKERGTFVINQFHRITKDELPEDSKEILVFSKASDEQMAWAKDVIYDKDRWPDDDSYNFTLDCLESVDQTKLFSCPAATHIHHSYSGGLLVHTAEVLHLCRSVVEASSYYKFISAGVLYAAAALHDIGKIDTYYMNDMGVAQSLPTEKTIGHLYCGMHLVHNIGTSKNINQNFINEVLHCIASHHGLPEYGSLKVVQSIEAGILSRMDYLSSRNGMIECMLQEAVKTGQPLQDEFRVYGDPYFASIGMRTYVEEGKA